MIFYRKKLENCNIIIRITYNFVRKANRLYKSNYPCSVIITNDYIVRNHHFLSLSHADIYPLIFN